ncbi:MAG: transglycosylase SLT domain-containing protein [Aggregatilineales bacterium]
MNQRRMLRVFCIGLTCLLIGNMAAVSTAKALNAKQVTPTDAMSAAKSALFNGDYDAALTLYTSASADPNLKCDALFGMGTTNLRAERYDDAESAFTRSLTECAPTFRSYVLRGDARRALNKPETALADYQQALALNPGLIDSCVYERMASVSADQSITYLSKAVDAPRPLAGRVALRKRLVSIFNALGNVQGLEQQYNAILTAAQSSEDLAEAEESLGELEIGNHRERDGYKHLQHVLTTYPTLKPAFNALLTLVTAGQDVDLLLRSRVNVANQNYRPTVNKLSVYLATAGFQAPAELYVLFGQAQRGLEQFADAIATFQKVRDNYPKDAMASVAALEQGITYETARDFPNAVKAYTDTAALYTGSAEAPRALWKAAQIETKVGHAPQAVALYDQLATQYPRSALAPYALSGAGMLLSSTDPAHAAGFFAQMGNAEGLLWQGKMLQAAGDLAGAQKAWTGAVNNEPNTFFGLRAQELLSGAAPFAPPDRLNIPQDTAADLSATVNWINAIFKLTSASAMLSPGLAHDLMLIRGTELWGLGWWPEANEEFDGLYSAYSDDASSLLQLAVYFQGLGVYRSSLTAAERLITLSGASIDQVPPYLARLAYPIDYSDILIPTAQSDKLDPLFVASIIRTESRFDAHALGGGEDSGLMQMIPSTAVTTAAQLNVSNFQAHQLFQPIISLKFGSQYLSSLRDALRGNLAAVVVGYNAGVDYSRQLFLAAGGDVDRLYQTIDFNSVQNYLSYTYEEYAIYRLLY